MERQLTCQSVLDQDIKPQSIFVMLRLKKAE